MQTGVTHHLHISGSRCVSVYFIFIVTVSIPSFCASVTGVNNKVSICNILLEHVYIFVIVGFLSLLFSFSFFKIEHSVHSLRC